MKKIISAILAVLMLAAFTGCGGDTSWIAKSGDITVPVGAYLYYGLTNYLIAMGKIDASKAFSKGTEIDGVPTSEWITNESVKNVKASIAVENKCKELGIELSEEDILSCTNSSTAFYKQMESKVFAPNGISQSSIYYTTVDSFRRDLLFRAYYDEGGIEAVPQSEVDAYVNAERARVKWIAIQLKDGEGNLLKSEGKAEMKKLAEEYINSFNAGEDFDSLIEKEDNRYKKLIEEATGEAPKSEFDDEKDKEDPYRNEYIIYKDGTVPTEDLNKAIFEKAKVGTPIFMESDETYYVVLRYDVTEREDFMEENRLTFLYAMKDDGFDAMIQQWADEMDININQDALKKYKPEKFDLKGLNG